MRVVWMSLLFQGLLLSFAQASSISTTDAAADVSEYLALNPTFITNYGGPGRFHYLKADIVVRIRGGEQARETVKHHLPLLRHHLVMLFSRQSPENVNTMAGRETLRRAALETVQELLHEETGAAQVDDLLFSSFVIQR